LLQIVKRPTMQGGSLGLLNRYPVANALQVFQGNAALSALSLCHDAFADAMVGVARKTMLFTCQLFQAPFGGFGAFLLQLATQAAVAVADVVDVVGAVDFAIAVGGEVDNAAINAQVALDLLRDWLLNVASGQQIPLATMEPQVTFALLMLEQVALLI